MPNLENNASLEVTISSTSCQQGLLIHFKNTGSGSVMVGMPHPENPYATKLLDRHSRVIETGWGVFAPPKPLSIARLMPQEWVESSLPLTRIYWRYSTRLPESDRLTPPIDGDYSVALEIPWMDLEGNEHRLPASGVVALRLTEEVANPDWIIQTVSAYSKWIPGDLLKSQK